MSIDSVRSNIVTLQIGGGGNRIGANFWEKMMVEHDIGKDSTGISKSIEHGNRDVFFKENEKNGWIPRCVLVDTDPGVVDDIRSRTIGKLFSPDSFVSLNSSGCNYAKAKYVLSQSLNPMVLDTLRKEVERCDKVKYFQLFHTLSGATGSGICGSLSTDLEDRYPKINIYSHSIFPSLENRLESVVALFNSVFVFNQLIEYVQSVLCFDNPALLRYQALHNCSSFNLTSTSSVFRHLNSLVSQMAVDVTASQRFSGPQNTSLHKVFTSLIPFPRMHFFVPSVTCTSRKSCDSSVKENINKLIDPSSYLTSGILTSRVVDEENGGYNLPLSMIFTSSFFFRGALYSTIDVSQSLRKIKEERTQARNTIFCFWIPNNIQISVTHDYHSSSSSKIQDTTTEMNSLCCLLNLSGMSAKFVALSKQYWKIFRRQKFIHWYTQFGMENMEMIESESNLNDMVSEYNSYSWATHDEEGEYSDEEL